MQILMIKEFLRKIFPDTIWKIFQLLKKNWLAFRYKLFGRPYNPGETTKARNRRIRKGFFA